MSSSSCKEFFRWWRHFIKFSQWRKKIREWLSRDTESQWGSDDESGEEIIRTTFCLGRLWGVVEELRKGMSYLREMAKEEFLPSLLLSECLRWECATLGPFKLAGLRRWLRKSQLIGFLALNWLDLTPTQRQQLTRLPHKGFRLLMMVMRSKCTMIVGIKGVETAKPIKQACGKSQNNRKTCGKMSAATQ